MALYYCTLATLKAAVNHVLGGTPTGANAFDVTDCVNRAVQLLTTAHPWTWLQRPLSLNLVAAQDYVDLPADFSQLHVLRRAAGAFLPCEGRTIGQIHELRQDNATATGCTFYAVSTQPQATATSLPTRRLELFPSPAADEAGGLVGVYLRVLPALAGDTDVPDVPAEYHTLLRYLCRALAASDELEQQGPDWAMFNTMLPSLIARDGAAQQTGVPMRGGLRGSGPVNYRPHASIQA